MVTCFWPKLMKCPKMGSKCQIFASLLARKTLLKEYYNAERNSKKWGRSVH